MQGSMGKALQAGTKAQKGGCIHRFSITLSLKELIHRVIFRFESLGHFFAKVSKSQIQVNSKL